MGAARGEYVTPAHPARGGAHLLIFNTPSRISTAPARVWPASPSARRARNALFVLVLLLPTLACANTLNGKVVKVVDGDTIWVLDANKQRHKIRLEGIDAPELGQPYGKLARQVLDALLRLDQYTTVITYDGVDRYGRILGTVRVNIEYNGTKQATNVNATLVEEGMAWAYRKYSAQYIRYEDLARGAKAGLWVDPDPIPPWAWRKQNQK